MITVDPASDLPIHAQLAESIVLAIARGDLQPGQRLPTVRELAVRLRINSNTVAKVYAELDGQGVLQTRRGLGTFVPAPPPAIDRQAAAARRLERLCRQFIRNCSAAGFSPRQVRQTLSQLARRKGT